MVSYDLLWQKLRNKTELPEELIGVFEYWYGHQINSVRWNNVFSEPYGLECGVRQGGLTSPRLFKFYVDELIGGLNRTGVGCSIDGKFVNNLSYADDMVLLAPSISALRKLLEKCEDFAVAHGLRYNVKKSNLLVFQSRGFKVDSVPPVFLDNTPLQRVSQYKYLGHWVTDELVDDADIKRERRALAVRGNMLARRFARCSREVKVSLFKAFCQSFYTCSLWVSYTQRAINTLRVQYNNMFRMLLGLPRYCSASGMFAEARTDGFNAIMRKRAASMMRRVRQSSSSILAVFVDKWESNVLRHWIKIHVSSTL
ncbi:uncharacterized protein LOC123700380 [Colias croceus]|uniref:uncharacterized protein LOC123700380 n=1 Tax=Colias crocea TaxID=72248 RepID=UPI001E2805EB|nr:uncharacterized protein LOC123700380 [Colias croceus]